MAKIKLGTIVTDISGKVGGNVFAKNKAGAYIRRKSTISNPQSVAQMLVRGVFASLSQGWRNLSDVNRQSWIDGAANFMRMNVFGDNVKLSGKALFQSLNQNLLNVGLAQIDTCPVPSEVPSVSATNAVIDISDNSITLINQVPLSGGNYVVIEMTPVLSSGKSFLKNDFRKIYHVESLVEADVLWDSFVAKYGVPSVGANIGLRFYTINANGQASPKVQIPVTVQA